MFEIEVRESMRAFPSIVQPALTWITGKPLETSERRFVIPRVLDVFITPILSVFIVVFLIWLASREAVIAWPLIVASWLLLVGSLRKMQVTHLHHAIHHRLFESPWLNKAYARFIPSIIFVQNGTEYRKKHLEHHNTHIFTTARDADAAFLAKLGFIPGRKKNELWINLWTTIFSPVFHFLFARARFESVLLRNERMGVAVALAMIALHISLIVTLGWRTFAIAIFIPMFLLYHVSALLQFLTEHAWNVAGHPVRDRGEYASRCWGRFCGEIFPQQTRGTGLRGLAKYIFHICFWCTRMLLLHIPVRVACLVSDLPAHDWHHLAHVAGQSSSDWPRSLYWRQIAISEGDKAGFASRELWGMPSMIEHQFAWLTSIKCTYTMPCSSERISSRKISSVRENENQIRR